MPTKIGRDVVGRPEEFRETTCLPPRIMAAWAWAALIEFGITDILGLNVDKAEDGRSPAKSALASVPGGSLIVVVPSGFVTGFRDDKFDIVEDEVNGL